MMKDALKALSDWLENEPNQTEVIIIRRRDNEFCVKIEYGDRTSVPVENHDLNEALLTAVDRADRLPSSKRVKADHGRKSLPGIVKLPGM